MIIIPMVIFIASFPGFQESLCPRSLSDNYFPFQPLEKVDELLAAMIWYFLNYAMASAFLQIGSVVSIVFVYLFYDRRINDNYLMDNCLYFYDEKCSYLTPLWSVSE